MNYALKLNNVTKTYKNSDFSLKKVSFSLPSGSVMGFVGENGAGKQLLSGVFYKRCLKIPGQSRF